MMTGEILLGFPRTYQCSHDFEFDQIEIQYVDSLVFLIAYAYSG